ncbi:brefeldin a-inhibited guanine nucleotide-exchange protein 1 [Nannochloropsis gaditana]|uniref:Brefeldin a-inhibited guanine nucleotide-exchange protein 1 n=1 Tax=Nannochloropsis gaditana TaxID=72520 RepID=W7U386_9STRA|nr:brefeldin a-inhibited guanine nucleotide-exchange protein 1 [Nannochloropsis gaditana]
MEKLVLLSLAKIRKLVSNARKHKTLRDACDTVIEHLQAKGLREEAVNSSAHEKADLNYETVQRLDPHGYTPRTDTDADKFFEPFKLACETKIPKIMEAALDAIQKLVAYGYLRGTAIVTFSGPGSAGLRRPAGAARVEGATSGGDGTGADGENGAAILMDVIIQTICDCNDQSEDAVQLQVMKALLECVISNTTQVHQASLLQAVRTCYNIHLVSRNPVNKTTARATLTQMLSIVFQRMESHDLRAREEAQLALQAMEQSVGRAGDCATFSLSPGKGPLLSGIGTPVTLSPLRSQSAVSSPRAPLQPPCGENLYPSVYLNLGFAPRLLTGGDADTPSMSLARGMPDFPSVLHKDAYLLFRALCRLSVKGHYNDGDSGLPADPLALHSKILSLELLLSTLERAGPTFRSSEKFVYLVRNHLCSSLLKNATSSNTAIVGLSLRIFIAMTAHFKDSLKAELDVFVSNIFLKLLESENSSFEHKLLVLQVFQNLGQDPRLLIEIFLNYDCDLGATSMFSRIVLALSKVAHGRGQQAVAGDGVLNQGASRRLQEEMALRSGGLEGLVAITKSLVKAGGFDDDAATAKRAALGASGEEAHGLTPTQVGEATAGVDALGVSATTASGSTAGSNVTGSEGGEHPYPAPSSESLSMVESYDRKQKLQEEVSLGLLKFNLKPSQGIAYMEAHGYLRKTPAEVARFLHDHKDRLDKTVIGDYLGKEKDYESGFCVKVLHEYVDMMDLQGLEFDQAIRHFLAGFRLPGEAQKIDRIMEKFAERFCLQNPAVFPSADTAFILSFSIIMLNTDLHNPSVREDRRMTKDDFIRNNRGISSGADLPEAFLSRIYDNIKRSAISLKEDDDMRAKRGAGGVGGGASENPFFSTLSLDKRRKEAYQKEREAMLQASEAIFRQRKRREAGGGQASKKNGNGGRTGNTGLVVGQGVGSTVSAYRSLEDPAQYVRPMFEVAWGPMLSVFSQTVKTSDDLRMISLSLEGFRHSIRIAARFNLPTARDLLVNTLYKFTALSEVTEVKPRNIDCIKTLIAVALSDGDYLNESWFDVLQCISHLARLQLFASGLHSDDVFFPEGSVSGGAIGGVGNQGGTGNGTSGGGAAFPPQRPRKPGGSSAAEGGGGGGAFVGLRGLFSAPSKAEAARQVDEFNAEQIMGAIDAAMIERVFTTSVALDSQAIQYFVLQLCEVSKMEVAVAPTAHHGGGGAYRPSQDLLGKETALQPRVFSLQKLVEVADFNMAARSRLVWANVWEVLSRHYAAVGLHDNVAVAMYAIDSLRQLSMKFLAKEELRDFNFQRLFLKPFEVIMATSRSIEIRELILRCLDNLISVRAHNIRSGWRSMFAVFSIAASSPDEGLCQFAFDIVDQLFRAHFQFLVFDFVDLVHCLLAFAENDNHLHVSLAAIAHLQRAGSLLAEGVVTAGMTTVGGIATKKNSPRSIQGTEKFFEKEGISDVASEKRAAEISASPSSGSGLATDFSDSPGSVGSSASTEAVLQLWWPLLVGLSARVADSRLPARTAALEALMNTLRQHGGQFNPQIWKLTFRGVLFPILESARTDCTPQIISEFPSLDPSLEVYEDSWILTTTESVLKAYVEILEAFWPLTQALMPEVLAVLVDCACQHERETLARISARVLHRDIVEGLAARIQEPAVWDALSSCLLGLVRKNLPEWGSLELLASAGEAGAKGAMSSRGLTPSNRATYAGTRENGARGDSAGSWHEAGAIDFSSPTDDMGVEEEENDGDEAGEAEAAERMAATGGRPGRDFSFSFAMVNNGTIMTQMVVSLLAQRMLRDLLATAWPFLNEDNLRRVLDALVESADYASEFNMNLSLRERLRQGGLMQLPSQQNLGEQGQLVCSRTGMAEVGGCVHASRLPHLHEQAIEGYTVLLRALLQLYPPTTSQMAADVGGLTWDRKPVVERVLVRYAALVLRQYVELEDDLASSREGKSAASVAAAHAMNTEVGAYTPLVLFILSAFKSLPSKQFGWHIDWLFPALVELLTVRSREVRKEVRAVLHTKVSPFVLGKEMLPPGPRAAVVAALLEEEDDKGGMGEKRAAMDEE